jgi:hypothetical protein
MTLSTEHPSRAIPDLPSKSLENRQRDVSRRNARLELSLGGVEASMQAMRAAELAYICTLAWLMMSGILRTVWLEHHHSGLGLLTPSDVHHGLAEQRVVARAAVLATAYCAHPER